MPNHIEPVRDAVRYLTRLGAACCGDSLSLLEQLPDDSVNLFMTSPPLLRQADKDFKQREYVDWLAKFGRLVRRKLRDDGSFVLDLGGGYRRDVPVRSLYQFRVPLWFCDELGFFLAQEFYWNNPSKLGPAEWVSKRKIRARDSVNAVWWFSKTEWPKANRPGVQPSNLLSVANSESNRLYWRGCKDVGRRAHPARFPAKLPEHFIKLLTDPHDLVVDIFSGSNVTGQVAEQLGRRWLSFELQRQYVATSVFRFMPDRCSGDDLRRAYAQVLTGESPYVADLWTPRSSSR